MTIDDTRITSLNETSTAKGRYVLYWMQQSQRAEWNHALEFAVSEANRRRMPLMVVFGLFAGYPEANRRHFTFMLEGLNDTRNALADRGIRLAVLPERPDRAALKAGADAALIVCDRGYLRHQRQWRRTVADRATCPVIQVESDVIVPVETVSPKAEYAARTIRPKIKSHLDRYLAPLDTVVPRVSSMEMDEPWLKDAMDDPTAILNELSIDRDAPPVGRFFTGGASAARRRFADFLDTRLPRYSDHRNQPQTDDYSGMSPYLHFGQISPLYLAMEMGKKEKEHPEQVADFLEELVIRRELSMNYARYCPDYDRFDGLPDWAKKTLREHAGDRREFIYDRAALEMADTHDAYWNAAMTEMKATGFMHNYMRMYWGKKVLEWSRTPQQAHATLLAINNKYFLDGRDPNSYAGVGWTFGLHDRAWNERAIFGKVRYMSAAGLKRKCDIDGYVKKTADLAAAAS